MEFSQTKLNYIEWNSIEIPVSSEELEILNLITNAYHDIDYKYNKLNSLLDILKLECNVESSYDSYLYEKFIKKTIDNLIKKYKLDYNYKSNEQKKKIKKADEIRIESLTKLVENNKIVYEFLLLDIIKNLFKSNKKKMYYYFSLFNMYKLNVKNINKFVKNFVEYILETFKLDIPIELLIYNADNIIEKNEYIYKYQDYQLYDHQKELFTIIKYPKPKLILYKAPTGTGKTMSPLGISEEYKVIFVCAARHVGLALAKAAISKKKKIAFCFGCDDIEDIKLHYFAVSSCIRDKRNGTIRKVDNTCGEKVEIIISDIKSYPSAMNYMLEFNEKNNIVLYWDEPTISLDYEEHELHNYIKNNWKINIIPNIVLSSATFPSEYEISDSVQDFKTKFGEESFVYTISSNDYKKTIPILGKDNKIKLPHNICNSYEELQKSINYCSNNLTILRYFDIKTIIHFTNIMQKNNYIKERYTIENYFETIEDVTISNIKLWYLELLKNISFDQFTDINSLGTDMVFNSTINITTSDSVTLTDGPTIYMTDNIIKIAKFSLQIAKIPPLILNDILKNIEYNNNLSKKISQLEKDLDDGTKKDQEKEKKISDGRIDESMKILTKQINTMRGLIKNIELPERYIPNKKEHSEKWDYEYTDKIFTSDIQSETVEKILLLNDVDDIWKILLLMGIGVFANHENKNYVEIMKLLSQEQKLFMIIASTDYIYGTNYQFCHGYIGKDLNNLTQEKTIQALGRIGRSKLQQTYTLRFRDDELVKKVFIPQDYKPEIVNINKLLTSE